MSRTSAAPGLAHDLRLATMRLARRLRQERGDHGLGLGQLSVLATLHREGPLTAGDLAAAEGVRPPSMTKTLGLLADADYITRTPDPADRRQVVISLTQAAHQLLHEDRRRRDEWLAARLRSLSADERAALAAALPVLEVLAES